MHLIVPEQWFLKVCHLDHLLPLNRDYGNSELLKSLFPFLLLDLVAPPFIVVDEARLYEPLLEPFPILLCHTSVFPLFFGLSPELAFVLLEFLFSQRIDIGLVILFNLLFHDSRPPLYEHWDEPVEQEAGYKHDGNHSRFQHYCGHFIGGCAVLQGAYEREGNRALDQPRHHNDLQLVLVEPPLLLSDTKIEQ